MDKKNLKVFSLISSFLLLVGTVVATGFALVHGSTPMCIMCVIMSMILSFMVYGDFKEIKDLEKKHG